MGIDARIVVLLQHSQALELPVEVLNKSDLLIANHLLIDSPAVSDLQQSFIHHIQSC